MIRIYGYLRSQITEVMKLFGISICSVLLSTLLACQAWSTQTPTVINDALPTKLSVSTLTPSPKPTNTFTVPTATYKIMTPVITATPFSETIEIEDDIERLVRRLYTWWSPCIGYNYAKESSEMPSWELEFIDVDIQPDPQLYWVGEVADNLDGSRQAFVACSPDLCQPKIYVADNETEKVYEINWGARQPHRPISQVVWLNRSVLAFYQSVNPERAQISVVDFDEKEYLYGALIFPDYFCSTSTPTP